MVRTVSASECVHGPCCCHRSASFALNDKRSQMYRDLVCIIVMSQCVALCVVDRRSHLRNVNAIINRIIEK